VVYYDNYLMVTGCENEARAFENRMLSERRGAKIKEGSSFFRTALGRATITAARDVDRAASLHGWDENGVGCDLSPLTMLPPRGAPGCDETKRTQTVYEMLSTFRQKLSS
jgi:hypothetical protein